jgi:hypothetical protein
LKCIICNEIIELSYRNLFSNNKIHESCKKLINKETKIHYYHNKEYYFINEFYFERSEINSKEPIEFFIYEGMYTSMNQDYIYLMLDTLDENILSLTLLSKLSDNPLIIFSFYPLF